VISGDTRRSPELIAHCQRCDVPIHEAYSPSWTVSSVPDWRSYRTKYHTSTDDLPKSLNVRRSMWPPASLWRWVAWAKLIEGIISIGGGMRMLR
jgi:hypothetical protein